MNRDAVVPVVLAICCLFAIGTAATSLESAVTTRPSEVIDVNYASLPIDSADAEQFRRRVEGGAEGTAGDAPPAGAPAGDTGDEKRQVKKRVGTGRSDEKQVKRDEGAKQKQQSKRKKQRKKQGAKKNGTKPPEETLVDRLLDLLATLLGALPYLVCAALLALAVRYRRRLAARLRPFLGRETDGNDGPPLGDPDPENEVASAWFEMVAGLGLDRDPARTPGECARRAVEAGLDREAVRSLTEAFEAVRYGDEPPSDERTRQARKSIRRLRSQGFGSDGA